ncbi:MAG: hypothetical protein BroJett025_04920 [Patescibacteria group bacterium]|nr:MAG: hypothetical protein BroJett025_04920 [Patescibacteria group bacterium]
MKLKVGKKVDPKKFKLGQIEDTKKLHKRTANLIKSYALKADVILNSCYLCGEKLPDGSFVTIYNFDYSFCSSCGHLSGKKRLSDQNLQKYYQENLDYSKTYTDATQIQYRLKNIAQPKVKFVMEHIKQPKEGVWLDVGCAIGDVVKVVEEYENWSAIGCDISKPSIEMGRKLFNIDLRQENISDFLGKNPRLLFDVVSFFGYFAVTSSPLKDMELAVKHLKKHGYIVVGDSNADSFSTIIQKSYPEFSTRHILPPNTTHQFTKKSIEYIFKKFGITPIAYWNFGLDFFELLKYLSLMNNSFQDTPLCNFLMENLNEFQKVIDKKCMGDYFIVIGQKTK